MSRSIDIRAWFSLPVALSAAMAAGCADVEPPIAGGEDAPSAEAVSALRDGDSCPPVEKFEPSVLSTDADEGRLVFTPDGKKAYFHVLDARGTLTIMESRRVAGRFTAPVVAPFSGVHDDLDAFVSPDGSRLFFSSARPVDGIARADFDLYVVARTEHGWSEPENLGPAVNTEANELFPTTTRDGTLYFNSDREGGYGAWDIYLAPRSRGGGFGPVQNLGPEVNTEHWEFNPAVTADGNVIVFGSLGRPDSFGGPDLYGSVRLSGDFLPAWNLGPCVNTAAGEYHPSWARRRGSLFFVRFSADPPTGGDFYEVGFGALLR